MAATQPGGSQETATAGNIESVHLTNFLNHHNLSVELCAGVNFITGENGSGKSAILTALCVALVRRWPSRRGGCVADAACGEG